MSNNEEKGFASAHINCEKPIYINIHSNYWKYWFFNVEIFTCFYKFRKKWKINSNLLLARKISNIANKLNKDK